MCANASVLRGPMSVSAVAGAAGSGVYTWTTPVPSVPYFIYQHAGNVLQEYMASVNVSKGQSVRHSVEVL
jgi:hypothetical protein